jgi:hypothetical protein
MANAMAFQYRYSPLGWSGIGKDVLNYNAAMKAGNIDKAQLLWRQATTKFAQGATGTAALIAAYKYREANQDDDWYNVKAMNGTTLDTRALFPIAPYFAVADFLVKARAGETAKTGEMVNTIIGMKLPAGTQATFLDQLTAAFSSDKEADAVVVNIGKVIGDFAGRFTQPFVTKQVYDIFDMFREDGTVARDPNVIEGEGWAAMGEAAAQRVAGKLPIAKEMLPAAAPRLKETDVVYKEGEFFNRLFGIRTVPNKTAEEKEVTRLGISPFAVYGPPSGNKEFDNAFVRDANKMVLPRMREVMSDPDYAKLSTTAKKIAMENAIRDEANAVRKELMLDMKFTPEQENTYYKMLFNKLPQEQRRVINEQYKKDTGITLEEAKDYLSVPDYQDYIKELKQFAKGGLVAQTDMLFANRR